LESCVNKSKQIKKGIYKLLKNTAELLALGNTSTLENASMLWHGTD